ncbi:MFS transporter [Rhodococcus opacus]|nr:MFS transporter [Rhodococcus opacus]
MSLAPSRVKLPDFIDSRPVSRYQYIVIALCGVVMFIDGFDTQSISYMAPHIAEEWGLSKQVLGPIFSAALAGLMVGYLALSPLSERFGHRRMILTSTVIFALGTLAAAWSQNVTELMALRFITGMGLGAAAPSAIALTGEFSPKRLRATFVLVIYCGFSLGFVAAGLVSGWLIPILGWRSVLVVGAVAPLLLLPALLRYLPDSLTSMINRGAEPNRIQAIFRKMDAALAVGPDITYEAEKRTDGQRTALRSLFTRDRVLGTLLLWLVFVINLGEFYALQSWLPSIMTSLDYDMGTVVTATTLTTVGGIAAAFVTGPCMDRLGAYVTLGTVYVVGFAFVALTGVAFTAPLWVLLTANFFAGVCISGGQKSLIALSAVFYPTSMRSTGVGWALGVGRLGGIVGPIAVGAALGMGWSASAVFYAMSVPMLVAGAAVFLLGRWVRSDNHPDRKSAESHSLARK